MATTSDEDVWLPIETPLKCAKLSYCIIQYSEAMVTRPESVKSWQTVLRAAEIRSHPVLIGIAKTLKPDEIPDV